MALTLRAARINKGLSRQEAAKLLGVGVSTIGNYERGVSYPDVPVIRKMEQVYGIPYGEMIFGTGKEENADGGE
ncbi:helix-turn-helix domain-containing protein [Intestinimonas butyriciproducens]|uniref:helix-turn-helix domain-containing protein n=1 Tax=Intestinimonas butyriciproducens TaxID=1297617 RepID=UPI001DC30F79|nr:helix-turn-helix transcriptional regulator [Intestinimonas butyriciproducens]MBM6918420.1 helix-turn-helix transcriptional regulator [Intestinimonas butyriciproducens]